MTRRILVPFLVFNLFVVSLVVSGSYYAPTEMRVDVDEFVDIKHIFSKLDTNENKITDAIETKHGTNDIVALMSDQLHNQIIDNLYGYPIDMKFEAVSAVSLSLTYSQIEELSTKEGIIFLEENAKLHPSLFDTTGQFGVNPSVWDLDLTGSSDMSIAIVDTGIDESHPAFSGRVLARYNALDDNATYPADDVGHGTHVAGVAAGAFNLTDDEVTISARGKILEESTNGFLITGDFSLVNFEGGDVIVEVDWADPGADNPGTSVAIAVVDFETSALACGECYIINNTGMFQRTFTLPAGDYLIGLANEGGAVDQDYESSVKYSRTLPSSQHPDVAGVAYSSNLVNVKVIDDVGNGDVSTFDTAINWIISNKLLYNISVVNLSLGIDTVSPTVDLLVKEMVDNGIVVVAAAGNEGVASDGINSPGSAPEAITVGAINSVNEITDYSSKGTSSQNQAVKPDVVAPGGSIASQIGGYTTANEQGFARVIAPDANIGFGLQNNDLIGYQGTSFAAPHIAGLAALLVQKINQTENWDWSSDQHVMNVKRVILAGTFETFNFGVGREEPSGANYDANEQSINRVSKDYHEGWGAVDARAAINMLSQPIELGFSQSLNFTTDNAMQNVYGWKLNIDADQSYGIFLSLPTDADVDLLLFETSEGPVIEGSDYGDLKIFRSSTQGMGQDESIGFILENSKEVYLVARLVDSNLENFAANLIISNNTEVPNVNILTPQNGEQFELGDEITITFESVTGTAEAYLNGEMIDIIESGYVILDLDVGDYQLRLVELFSNGFFDEDIVTFTILSDQTSTTETVGSVSLPLSVIWSGVFIALVVVPVLVHKLRRR